MDSNETYPGLAAPFTRAELQSLFDGKYRRVPELGSDPAWRLRFGYFNPDDHYEALMCRLVGPETRWLEVGCGRDIFPSNRTLARELADRCALLVGVDPDPNVLENEYVHQRVQGLIQDLPPQSRFDLVTLRMVAEHVVDPADMLDTLARLVVPGGVVVIFTIFRWSPVPLVTAVTPFALHHPIKRILWRSEVQDTFPTAYRMNTRGTLARLFDTAGFDEAAFWYLDDCRTFQRFRPLNLIELSLRTVLHALGLHYPEVCLLGAYRRRSTP